MPRSYPAILSCAVVLALNIHANAQDEGETEQPDTGFEIGQPEDDDCRVKPGDDSSTTADPKAETETADPETLTEKLEPCNGVLKPPPIGDQEITEPPPDAGETPIIRPGELPEQPPSSG